MRLSAAHQKPSYSPPSSAIGLPSVSNQWMDERSEVLWLHASTSFHQRAYRGSAPNEYSASEGKGGAVDASQDGKDQSRSEATPARTDRILSSPDETGSA